MLGPAAGRIWQRLGLESQIGNQVTYSPPGKRPERVTITKAAVVVRLFAPLPTIAPTPSVGRFLKTSDNERLSPPSWVLPTDALRGPPASTIL